MMISNLLPPLQIYILQRYRGEKDRKTTIWMQGQVLEHSLNFPWTLTKSFGFQFSVEIAKLGLKVSPVG